MSKDVESLFYDRSDLDFRIFRGRGETSAQMRGNVVEDRNGPFMLVNDHIEVIRAHKRHNGQLKSENARLLHQIGCMREGKNPDFFIVIRDGVPVDVFMNEDMAMNAVAIMQFKNGMSSDYKIKRVWK